MKLKNKVAAITAILSVLAPAAYAQDSDRWSGPYVAAGAVQAEQKLPETPTALAYTQEQARAMERALSEIEELLIEQEDILALDIIENLRTESIIT